MNPFGPIEDHFFAVRENPLVAYGYLSIGCFPCTQPVQPGDDARSGRWAGQAKIECGMALVCSEVVYKAYEGSVTLPLSTTMRRLNTPPNDIVREFDETYGTRRQQFDFVLFLDGHERAKKAVAADVDEFRRSWKRPKWHIVTR